MIVFIILLKNIKWRLHNAFTIIVTILQPILWLILYSSVANQTMKNAGIDNYTSYILPGLIILVSLSTCASNGIMNYMMKYTGSFYRILIAPVNVSFIVLGQILEAVLCTFLETFIMLLISAFLGVNIQFCTLEFLIIIILIFLTVFFAAGLSYGVSLILPNEIIYETVMNSFVLPIFFLSSALFPVNEIKGVLHTTININPFTHMINILRTLFLHENINLTQLILVLITFSILCTLSFIFACYMLKRETNL